MNTKLPPPNPTDPNRFLAPEAVAELLCISLRTIWRMVRAGSLPQPVRFSRKMVRFKYASLVEYLDRLDKDAQAEGSAWREMEMAEA